MALTLKSWVHPSTGEKRIYVNSPSYDRSIKIWIEDRTSADPAYAAISGWEIVVRANYPVNKNAIKNDISRELDLMGLGHANFSDLAA